MNVLKVDKDCFVNPNWLKDYVEVAKAICRMHNVQLFSILKVNSQRKGFHLYFHIRPVEDWLALRMQFLLGDDAQRVSMNRARLRSGLTAWNKLWWYRHRRFRTIYQHQSSGRSK